MRMSSSLQEKERPGDVKAVLALLRLLWLALGYLGLRSVENLVRVAGYIRGT